MSQSRPLPCSKRIDGANKFPRFIHEALTFISNVQQSLNNVMLGPWKKIADSYGKMVLGYFGKTPVAPDPDIVKQAADQLGL